MSGLRARVHGSARVSELSGEGAAAGRQHLPQCWRVAALALRLRGCILERRCGFVFPSLLKELDKILA